MDAKINEQVKNKKQDNLITAEIRYKMTAKGMMITEYYGADSCVVLPDEIEGETVTALDDYAFARNLEVEEIWLPEALKEVGRYAFYRCRNLKKLILGNQLLDMGGGALTGCRLEEVEIYFREGKKSCLKSIVEEMRYQIRVSLYGYSWRCCAEKNSTDEWLREVRILFPEHYEEAVENTPARILETHHHGAGGYYRQCFYNRELDYKKYDEMFYHTDCGGYRRDGGGACTGPSAFPGGIVGEEQKCLQNIHTGAYGNGGSVSGKERRYRRNPVPGAEEAVE